jgi:hypothetical protein
MKRWRAYISLYSPATLLVFIASVAAPHTGLVFHTHAGGEHVHVHADLLGESPREHGPAHVHIHPHPYHDLLAVSSSNVPTLEAPDDDAEAHWHAQNPFHRVAPVACATVFPPQAAGAAPAAPRVDAASGAVPPGRARAPPPSAEI